MKRDKWARIEYVGTLHTMTASSNRTHGLLIGIVLALVTGATCVASAGCAGGSTPRTVSLRLRGQPPAATVTIDDQWIGSLARVNRFGVALPPGRHRITVEAPGHFPWDRLVEVKEGDAPVQLDVALVPVPE